MSAHIADNESKSGIKPFVAATSCARCGGRWPCGPGRTSKYFVSNSRLGVAVEASEAADGPETTGPGRKPFT